jgi:hypothetical protein
MFGLPDASIAYFFGIFGCAFIGYVGGTLGASPLWVLQALIQRLLKNDKLLQQIDSKERIFYERIKIHRPKSIRINMIPGYSQLTQCTIKDARLLRRKDNFGVWYDNLMKGIFK